jgi:hypothetical protein
MPAANHASRRRITVKTTDLLTRLSHTRLWRRDARISRKYISIYHIIIPQCSHESARLSQYRPIIAEFIWNISATFYGDFRLIWYCRRRCHSYAARLYRLLILPRHGFLPTRDGASYLQYECNTNIWLACHFDSTISFIPHRLHSLSYESRI